jgi:hypothetical protein
MRKLAVGITSAATLLLVGIFVCKAEATQLTGSAILRSAATHSLIEKAACGGQGLFARCPAGQHWRCVSPSECECVPCIQSLSCSCPYKLRVYGTTAYCVKVGC